MSDATRRWRKENPERWRETNRKNSREQHASARARALCALGGRCVRCGFSDPRALQIDHVNGGGNDDFKRLHAIPYLNHVLDEVQRGSGKFQLLCANCNWIKKSENAESNSDEYHSRKGIKRDDDDNGPLFR